MLLRQPKKIHVTGHYGMVSRKNATASSNVNEFLSVYFLVQPPMTPDKLVDYVSQQKGNTGVLKGERHSSYISTIG